MKIKCRTILAGMLAALCAIISFQPANAYTLSSAAPKSITSLEWANSGGGSTISNIQYWSGGTTFRILQHQTNDVNYDMRLGINTASIPANSLVSITMSVSGANTHHAPLCFTGGYGFEILDCDINGDNANYTISALGYTTGDRTYLALFNYVVNRNLTQADTNTSTVNVSINDPYVTTVTDRGLTDSDIATIKQRLSNINDDVYNSRLKLDDIKDTLQDILDNLEDASESIIDTNERQNQATDNIENQSTSDSEYSQSTNQQTTSLISAFGGFVSALGSIQATNCNLSLPLPNFVGGTTTVNACTAKTDGGNDVINIINIASSIVAIIFYIPFALMMINLIYKEIRSFTN